MHHHIGLGNFFDSLGFAILFTGTPPLINKKGRNGFDFHLGSNFIDRATQCTAVLTLNNYVTILSLESLHKNYIISHQLISLAKSHLTVC